MGQRLLGVGAQMCRKVVRSTERLVTSREITLERALLCVDQHMSLKVLVALEAPFAAGELTRMLVIGSTAGRGHRRGRADGVIALNFGAAGTDSTGGGVMTGTWA